VTDFSIAVFDASDNAILVPSALNVRPVMWSAIAAGGMLDAQVEIAGDVSQLWGITAWLGYRIEIINRRGTAVWWGDIQTVEIVASGLRRGISLSQMANKISVRYSQTQPGGAAVAADTTWASDTSSIAKYSTFERRITPAREMTEAIANGYRATALATLAVPFYTLLPDEGDPVAILTCTGIWQRMGRTYYSQAAGLEEHNLSGVPIPLGQGFTSTKVAFVASTDTVHSTEGKFTSYAVGSTVKVAGASNAGNNNAFEITGVDDRDAVTYVSTGITFSANDDIADAGLGLGFLEVDDAFTLAGSSSNSGTHKLKKAGADAVEVSPGYFGGNITGESAGPSITFARGNSIDVGGNLTDEQAGASVTVTTWGQKIYSSFALAAALSWTVAKVEIRIRKIGTPTDNVKIQLVADSTNSPGTLIEESAVVAAADIPTEMGWVSFDFANSHVITNASTYGLVILRTGSNSDADYYEVDVDDALGYTRGVMKVYDGANWQTPSPDTDLIFRVLGEVDTGDQIELVLAGQDWPKWIDVATSGLVANQWREGELTSMDEVASLMSNGTSGASRMVARVTRDLAAVVTARPAPTTARFVWKGANRLTDFYGQDAEPGYLPAGQWVKLGDDQNLGPWSHLSPVFVERAEYRIDAGLTLEPEGQSSIFDLGVQQG
jgi:hypothetical protein